MRRRHCCVDIPDLAVRTKEGGCWQEVSLPETFPSADRLLKVEQGNAAVPGWLYRDFNM
jgi:hypothetical protein